MKRFVSVFFGIGLMLLGGLALFGNLALPVFGLRPVWWQFWRLWPLAVLGLGAFLGFLPFVSLKNRGLGALFIPALPILSVGGLLMFCSLFDQWSIWSIAWPAIILAVALGFVFAAVHMRTIWLGIPAILIGLNGLALGFCALTGLWEAWSVLWLVEPLAIGLVLLLTAIATRSSVLFLISGLVCAFTVTLFLGLTSYLTIGRWDIFRSLYNLAGPALLIAIGGLLLIATLLPRRRTA